MLQDAIRKRRQDLGLTQCELAEKLQCRQSTVSGWERGERMPRVADLYRLAEVLGCKAADLMQ